MQPALAHTQSRGLRELHLLASLVADTIVPGDAEARQSLHYQARTSPWIELALSCLALDGRRWHTLGDRKKARTSYKALLNRTQHLDDHFHQSIASMGLSGK